LSAAPGDSKASRAHEALRAIRAFALGLVVGTLLGKASRSGARRVRTGPDTG
jgi:hypothetical protein